MWMGTSFDNVDIELWDAKKQGTHATIYRQLRKVIQIRSDQVWTTSTLLKL